MSDLLDQTIDDYRRRHGDPEYRYFKKRGVFSRREHIFAIGEGEEVTKEEYDANIAESERLGKEAFWGRLKQSYWKYYRNKSKDGWREALVKDIEAHS
jgi:hypothetical protein